MTSLHMLVDALRSPRPVGIEWQWAFLGLWLLVILIALGFASARRRP